MKDVIVLAGGDSERGILLRDKLASDQYSISSCQSLAEFSAVISREKIAAIILLYPDDFGIINPLFDNNIISRLAGKITVVFISTSSTENKRVRSLHYKADEFLIEPISTDEIAKIIDDSIRSRLESNSDHILSIGDLILNRETLIVTWRNKKIPLYPLQVRLIEFLMLNPGRTIGRVDLLDGVWSTGVSIEHSTIDRNIKRIRDAFKRKAKVDPIRTLRRVGYALDDQFQQLSSLPKKGRGIRRPEGLRARRVLIDFGRRGLRAMLSKIVRAPSAGLDPERRSYARRPIHSRRSRRTKHACR